MIEEWQYQTTIVLLLGLCIFLIIINFGYGQAIDDAQEINSLYQEAMREGCFANGTNNDFTTKRLH